MAITCTELITRLENIKINKTKLDHMVGQFVEAQKSEEIGGASKLEKLNEIFSVRREMVKEISDVRIEQIIESGRAIERTVLLGTGLKTPRDFIDAFMQADKKTSDGARDLISSPNFVVSQVEKEIKTLYILRSALNLPASAPLEDVYIAGKKLGLELCPAEVGPQLRIQADFKEVAASSVVCMKPLMDSHGRMCAFNLIEYSLSDQWLTAPPVKNLGTSRIFVFVRK
jgi:hypothetical protein